MDPFDRESFINQWMVSNSCLQEKGQQHLGRRFVQGSSDRDGMGIRYGEFSMASESRFDTSGGLVRHQRKLKTVSICISHPRRGVDRDRRLPDGLDVLEDDLPISTGKDATSSSFETGVLRRIGSAGSSLLAQSILVSETATDVHISQEISTSSTYADCTGDEAHRRFVSYLGPSRLDFLRRCLTERHGLQVADYLVHEHRESSIRQYETAWTALLRYVRLKKLCSFSENTILRFFIWLFEKCKLQANTISSYRCALIQPLQLGFDIVVNIRTFLQLSRSFFLKRPPPTMVEPQWCLNKVLNFLKTRRFTTNPSLEDITLKALFLLALASGRRVGELHSLLRRKGFIVFGGHYSWVCIHPNPQFLAKNETSSFRRGLIMITTFRNADNEHHVLCPVDALRKFLIASRGLNLSSFLIVLPSVSHLKERVFSVL